MSAPDYSRGYLRIPNGVWEALLCRAPLSRRQLQLACVVIRETWGWQAPGGGIRLWSRPLTTGDFAQATGLATDRIARDLAALERLGLLRQHDRRWQFLPEGLAGSRPSVPAFSPGSAGPAFAAAETTPAAPGRKTEKKKEKNDAFGAGTRQRPAVHNQPTNRAALRADLFRRLVEAAAGPLPVPARQLLADRIREDGIAAVWADLAPAFHKSAALRRQLVQFAEDDRAREGSDEGAES